MAGRCATSIYSMSRYQLSPRTKELLSADPDEGRRGRSVVEGALSDPLGQIADIRWVAPCYGGAAASSDFPHLWDGFGSSEKQIGRKGVWQ